MSRYQLPGLATALTLTACATAVPPPAPVALPRAVAAAAPSRALPPGKAMLPGRTIVTNVEATVMLSTLGASLRTAGLAETLAGPGPFTLFAPTDAAFARLPPDALRSLLNPANRTTLARVLRYHVVPGAVTTADLLARLRDGAGEATLTTLAGVPIRVTMTADVITLTSETGNKSYIEVADLRQGNGVIQIVNGVLIPALD